MTRRPSFADISLDARNGWLICGETRVDIRPVAARLFAALIAARGNTVTGAELCQAMRKPGHPEVSLENLRVTMFDLRSALFLAGSAVQVANRIGYGWRLDPGRLQRPSRAPQGGQRVSPPP
jgi:hypothetical protein